MPLHAIKKACRCCQLPCISDSYFERGNVPTIITTEYEDQCGCRIFCSYPNNVYTIILAQLLTLVSFSFPAKVIDPDSWKYLNLMNKTISEEELTPNATERGLGFFTWEYLDGSCASGGQGTYTNSTFNGTYELTFFDVVSTDWKAPRVMAIISFILSVIILIWTFSLACVATKRQYRAVLSFLLILVQPLFQSLTFLVFRTDFCETNDCQLGGSGERMIAAILLSVVAGILLCVGTTNFPGNPYTKKNRTQRCGNLLFCRNTCRQLVMEENSDPEHNNVELVATNNHVDVMEVPVESDFFDSALIDGNAIPATPAPVEISVASLAPTVSADAAVAASVKTL